MATLVTLILLTFVFYETTEQETPMETTIILMLLTFILGMIVGVALTRPSIHR